METIMKGAKSIQDLKKEDESMTSSLYHDRALPVPYVGTSKGGGMDDNFNRLQQLLIGMEEDQSQHQKLRVISVTGKGGIGKTFLVQKIWHDQEVTRYFDCRAWVTVDHDGSERKEILLSTVLNDFCYGTAPYDMGNMDVGKLLQAIKSQLQGKKFLLVLDDVWDIIVWDLVAPALPQDSGGRVIITTRIAHLASTSDIAYYHFQLEELNFKQAYDLFCQIALPSIDDTHPRKELAQALVRECQGVPLAIKAVANLARQNTDWEKIFNDLGRDFIGDKVSSLIQMSFDLLSSQTRYVFLAFCLFPEDSEIRLKDMIRLCVAEGFVDDSEHSTAEESVAKCIEELVTWSLIMEGKFGSSGNVKTFEIHDLVRDTALRIIEAGLFPEFVTWKGDTPIPPHNVRRFSIVGNSSNIRSNNHEAHLRSCFVFDVDDVEKIQSFQLLLGGFRELRILNLRNTRITKTIVHKLGNLIHLHYLGLRGTHINELPASFSKLRSLQTFDIRETKVSKLPRTFISLEKLRHVHLVGSFMRKVVEFPLGRKKLKPLEIQTLAGVKASTRLIEELGCCTLLKKLSIGNVSGDDSTKLCASINNMHALESLTIKTRGADKLQMETLSLARDWSKLHTLKIGGRIESLSHLVSCFGSISRLHLWDSMLDEDPFVCLQRLTNLGVLCLSNVYSGNQMICNAGSFPNLKKLSLLRMRKLEQWGIMPVTMASLKDLYVAYCPNLKAVPENLETLSSLQLVQVSEMPQEFTIALQEKSRDRFKVNCFPQFVDV